MTRRNEDSGLIDLDALLREATAKEAVELHEARPQSARASAPTPTPVAVRSQAPTEPAAAPSVRNPIAAPVSTPKALDSKPVESQPKPVEAKPVAVESEAKVAQPTPPIVLDRRPANDITSEAVPAAPVLTTLVKSVPPAPETQPSKLQPDSLEGVTTEPGMDPWVGQPAKPEPTVAAAALSTSEPKSEPKRGRSRMAIGAIVALAAALGIGFVVRSRQTAVTSASAAVAPTAVRSNVETKNAAALSPAEPASAAGLSADELPAVASAAPTPSARVAAVGAHAPAKGDSKPAPAATLTEAALEAATPSGAGDLGDAMRGAVGAKDHAKADTDEKAAGSNAAQVRPSPGAVVGALGSVLPAARACLSPDDSVRSGLVVFKSDGTVARVEIKGAKPEDECVRSALAKAKVAPFVEETFSTRVTVRP